VSDVHYLSATEARALFAAGKLSPVELMTAVIDRAETVEPTINAFPVTLYESAMAQARVAERRYASGDALPLDGIPVAVKEEAPIAGQPNVLGSLAMRGHVADKTAVFVQRILDAGGIVHARSATPEFSSAPVTWSKLWGVTRNPWNPDYSPGGSSGGSGAALAAGSTTLATGSDIGGSIRIPSSFCGVVGFKPPYGRVPEVEIFNLDHYCHEGPLARTVADCALLQNVIAGPHPSDVASIRPKLEIPVALEPVRGLRIALSTDLGCFDVAPDVAACAGDAAERLRAAGATVEPVDLPWRLADIKRAARIHFGAVMGASIAAEFGADLGEDFTSYVRGLVRESEAVSKNDIVAGLLVEARIYEPLGTLLEDYDALLCPTFAVAGVPAEWKLSEPLPGRTSDDWLDVMMTLPFNIASRCPVVNIPAGTSADGVPIGMSVVARTYDDVTAFRVAAAHEGQLGWWADGGPRPAL
jgi:Asp-tRNA(Asn)/Glu-tRNA(Gln) amidotransferase A subunit family amidase